MEERKPIKVETDKTKSEDIAYMHNYTFEKPYKRFRRKDGSDAYEDRLLKAA